MPGTYPAAGWWLPGAKNMSGMMNETLGTDQSCCVIACPNGVGVSGASLNGAGLCWSELCWSDRC